ncbi:phosphoglycerate kinase [Candidatus Bathyarchaeota archaeon]|nr:phosphoglycerate kinase [Candidatus Bathyarchaeota archaeon]
MPIIMVIHDCRWLLIPAPRTKMVSFSRQRHEGIFNTRGKLCIPMSFTYKTIDDVDLDGKRVLLRVDMNSPVDLEKHELRDDQRIRAIVPTVKALASSKLVVIAHQSRPGKKDFTSLEMHADRLDSYVDQDVKFVEDIYGEKAIAAIENLSRGEVLVLDNVRKFDKENESMSPEEAAGTEMVKTLAPMFDYFVNDAFGAAHRAQPSIIGWPTLLAGPLVEKELKTLKKLMDNPEKPMVMLVGGAKAKSKYKASKYNIENDKVDKVLVAGLTAVLLAEASGQSLGDANRKLVEKELDSVGDDAKAFMASNAGKVLLPLDYAYEKDGKRMEATAGEIGSLGQSQGDIGAKTIELFKKEIMAAKTIVANGPPGIFEKKIFQKGTHELITAMAISSGFTVIGGGEMGTAAEEAGKASKISFISTGGGAMLQFLSGKELPLLVALEAGAKKL